VRGFPVCRAKTEQTDDILAAAATYSVVPMKVRSTHRFPGPAWDELDGVEIAPADTPGPDVDVLVVLNEPVDFELYPSLRLIANYSVGYDRIDVDAANARGVAVTNTPGVLDAATADLALALMLAARRGVVTGDRLIRAGGWAGLRDGREVSGATLAVVGAGRIGSAVARRAAGFDMRVLLVRRSEGDLDAALREADIVTLHVPLNPETRGLLSRERLALLKDGATLVNTARGAVVDEDALVAELTSGRITAGLDVFAHEPHVPGELLDLPNVVLTPHIASDTIETRAAMSRVVVDNVLAHMRGEPLPNPVTQ
jgi:glyoxylate reductase